MNENSYSQNTDGKMKNQGESEIKYILNSEADINKKFDLKKNLFEKDSKEQYFNKEYELQAPKPKTFNVKLKRTRTSGIFNLGEINEFLNGKKKINKNNVGNNINYKKNDKDNNKNIPKTWKKIISSSLDHNITILIMTIATVYALILSDINTIFLSPDYDIVFSIFSSIVFFLFLIEFVLSIISKANFNGTFFFWLDLFSLLSMLMNIDWIVYPVFEFFSNFTNNDSTINNLGFQKVIRNLSGAVRATRVTRLLRIIRIIRLIRLFRLYKNVMIAKKNRDRKKALERIENRKLEESKRAQIIYSDESVNINELDIKDKNNKFQVNIEKETVNKHEKNFKEEISETPYEDILSESKISEKLSYSMTKHIITLIMLLLLTFPYINLELYNDGDLTNYSILFKYLENYYEIYGKLTEELNFTIFNLLEKYTDENYPILNITYNNSIIYENDNYLNSTFRLDEVNYFFDDNSLTVISYSTKYDNLLNAILNILRIIYIALILGWMIVKLDEDSKTYALYPLENIMDVIQRISRDPIGSRNIPKSNMKENNNPEKHLSINNNTIKNTSQNKNNLDINSKRLGKNERNKLRSKSNYEVKTIEAAVIKISALLAIGFGEAGEAIIKHNLKHGTQQVDPMVKGRKKIAIFGFCDIRQFPIVNECLQERTMSFVNQIANIVHTSVDYFMGAANKNIGDAFLCVWKFRNSKNLKDGQNKNLDNKNKYSDNKIDNIKLNKNTSNKTEITQTEAADRALLGYLNIILWINKKRNILVYRYDKDILNRIPDYKVKMGFGLHIGWAIEGAIGSHHKIDASYLSPNVNMSSRLEAATKQYEVSILISGDLFELLSANLKEICRLIDIVTVKGSKKPIKLYTVDVNLDLTPSEKDQPNINLSENRKIYEEKKERFYKMIEENGSIGDYIKSKDSFKEMLNLKRPKKFKKVFSELMEHYISGEWNKAQKYINKCLEMDPNDGPCKVLNDFMGGHDFDSPKEWKGFRELMSK